MLLENQDVVDAPLNVVYLLIRDEVNRLAPFLPHIDRIETIERVLLNDHTRSHVNHWFAKVEVPSLARKYLKPEFLGWKEKVIWNDQDHSADFQMESFVGAALFEASGTYRFRALDPKRTEIRVQCEVRLTLEKNPVIPKSLALVARPMIEALIRRMIEPSLKNLSTYLNRYFAETRLPGDRI